MPIDFKNCPIKAELEVRIVATEKLAAQSLESLRHELASFRVSVHSDTSEIKQTLEKHGQVLFGNGGVGTCGNLAECKLRLARLEINGKEARNMANAWRMQRWGWAVAVGIALFSAATRFIR